MHIIICSRSDGSWSIVADGGLCFHGFNLKALLAGLHSIIGNGGVIYHYCEK